MSLLQPIKYLYNRKAELREFSGYFNKLGAVG